jgi:hypothetical protein
MATKTLEFKVRFSDRQLQKVERYLEICRHIWNHGLTCLVEHEQFVKPALDYQNLRDGKPTWGAVPCSPLPWSYRRINPKEDWREGNIVPFCRIVDSRRPYRQCCPIPQPYRTPRLGLTLLGKYSLQYYFAQKNHPGWADLQEIGSWYCRGVSDDLWKAWSKYKTRTAGKPRFKGVRDGYSCLTYGDGAKLKVKALNAKDGEISIPKVGVVKIQYLYQDLGELPIAVLRIVKKPDGWYCQIVCSRYPDEVSKPSKVKIGLCPVGRGGVLAVDDRGKEYKITLDETRLLNRQKELQRRAARQRRKVQTLQQQGSQIKGSNLAATERKIARISQLLSLRRSNQRKKIASFIARKAGEIALIKPSAGFIPHPDPILTPGTFPVKYEPNGATVVADVNKERSAHGVGELVALVKQKGLEHRRLVVDSPKIPKKEQKKASYSSLAKAAKNSLL